MSSVKNFLKKILPPPVRTFLREMAELRELTEQQTHQLVDGQNRTLEAMERQTQELMQLLTKQVERAEELHRINEDLLVHLEQLEQGQRETLVQIEGLQTELEKVGRNSHIRLQQAEAQRKALSEVVERTWKQSIEGTRFASEAVWAETFNNTISNSAWLKNTAFSPGRWAVGYPYLYVLYRVLNEIHPKCILEFGLGQTTQMIGMYATAFPNVEHIVVEQDHEWTEFFKRCNPNLTNTNIIHVPVVETEFYDDNQVLVYKDLLCVLGDKKFDFISADGPAHSRSKKYRRADILGLVPLNLASSFCILMDDMNEMACYNTYEKFLGKLNECNVEFVNGFYYGKKAFNVTASPDNKFLTTL